jgi:hypothetical protein
MQLAGIRTFTYKDILVISNSVQLDQGFGSGSRFMIFTKILKNLFLFVKINFYIFSHEKKIIIFNRFSR